MSKELLKKLEYERGVAVARCHELQDLAEKENRSMTAEENTSWEAAYKTISDNKAEIEKIKSREERMSAVDAELGKSAAATKEERSQKEKLTLVVGDSIEKEKRELEKKEKEHRSHFNNYLLREVDDKEFRALTQTDPTQGGYLVAPQQMAAELIKNVDDQLKIRALCRVLPALKKVASLGVLTMPNKMSSATWGTECELPSADSAMRFGKREFVPNPMASVAIISEDLMRNATLDPDGIVRGELERVNGELQEQAFISGDGDKKPLGLLTASNDGIPSSRHSSTGHSSTAVTFDGFINNKFALKPQYRNSNKLSWLFHSDVVKQSLKIKDQNDQYIWQQSVKLGEPDRILNVPIVESQFMPNTFTTGQVIGIIGDFNYYWIIDVVVLEIKVSEHVYFMQNKLVYKARGYVDGQPVLAEAFSVVKLA